MAIWQQPYFIVKQDGDVPATQDLECLRAELDSLLPRVQSWSPEMEQWGASDRTTADILVDGECIEILVRVDARVEWRSFLVALWESLTRAGYCVRSQKSESRFASLDELIADMQSSRAVLFTSDPWKAVRDGARETAAELEKESDA